MGRAQKAESTVGLGSEMEGKLQESRAMLKLYSGLQKAESSVLVQACRDRIGLARFLYNRRVPRVRWKLRHTQCNRSHRIMVLGATDRSLLLCLCLSSILRGIFFSWAIRLALSLQPY